MGLTHSFQPQNQPNMSRLTTKRHPDLLVSGPYTSSGESLTFAQCCSFNQDYSCIAVGHKKGYTILNCDPFGKVHSKSAWSIQLFPQTGRD